MLEHVRAENARDVDAVLATFTRPRYEIVPTGAVHEGESAVRSMLEGSWAALPDDVQWGADAIYHGDDGVVVVTRTTGTAPDGTPIDFTSVNLFEFDGLDLVSERCWFDRPTTAVLYGPAT